MKMGSHPSYARMGTHCFYTAKCAYIPPGKLGFLAPATFMDEVQVVPLLFVLGRKAAPVVIAWSRPNLMVCMPFHLLVLDVAVGKRDVGAVAVADRGIIPPSARCLFQCTAKLSGVAQPSSMKTSLWPGSAISLLFLTQSFLPLGPAEGVVPL